MTEKVDKMEVKKAIRFLEEKIKEIIFLIAGSYEQGADGAMQKKKITCLSCDKDVESKLRLLKETLGTKDTFNLKEKMSETMRRKESSMKLRATTSNNRKNVRLSCASSPRNNKGLISPVQFD